MRHHCHWGVALLAICGLYLAGCATPPRGPTPKEAGPPETSEVDSRLVEAHAHYALGMMYDVEDQSDEALAEFAKAAEADPSNEQLALDLSARYLRLKESEKALAVLERAAAVPEASGIVYAQLGLVYSRLGKDDQAIAASRTAIKRAPQLMAGYRNLFLIHMQKGRTADALAVLEQAGKQPDPTLDFLIDLSEFYSSLERQAPARKEAARAGAQAALALAVKLTPDNSASSPYLQLKLAEDFNKLGDTTNAAQIYLRVLKRYGDQEGIREDVRARLADIYLRGNDSSKAMEQLEAIVKDDPVNALAYYYLGSLAYDAKNLDLAENYFQKSLLINDDSPDVFYDLAAVQIDRERPKSALLTLQRAHVKFPPSFRSEFLTAAACERDKDYTNAVNHYTAAEVLAKVSDPKRLDHFFYFQAGAAYERKGDLTQAEKLFEKSLEISPEFAEALNYLGYMLAEHGTNLGHARELIEKAVKLEPKNAAYVDSLAWVLYKLNQPGEALNEQLKAIALSPEPDATLYDHLGDIYAALHQTDKAQEAWRKSLDLAPSEEIRRKLGPSETK